MPATYTIVGPDQSDRFYQLPTSLLLPEYADLSPDAKLLYAIILDRTLLSTKNASQKGWETSRGVYCRCNRQMVMRLLSCGPQKASGLYKQLEEASLLDIPDHVSGDLYLKKTVGMISENDDPYFHSKQTCNYQYLRVPKTLFTDDYCSIPGAAKLVYTYMLNGCYDAEITIKQKDITAIFGFDPKSVRKYCSQLCAIGLLEHSTKSQVQEKSPQPSSQGQEDTKTLLDHSTLFSGKNQEVVAEKPEIHVDIEREKRIWDLVFDQLGSYADLISSAGNEGLIINEIVRIMIDSYTRQSGICYINKRKRPIRYLHEILHRLTPLHIGSTLEAVMANLTIGHYQNFPAYVRAVLINSVLENLPYRKPPMSYTYTFQVPDKHSSPGTKRGHDHTNAPPVYAPQNRPSRDMYERLLERPACG